MNRYPPVFLGSAFCSINNSQRWLRHFRHQYSKSYGTPKDWPMNIEDVVNSTAKAILVFWLRHWPLCLLTLWAVASLWASANINSTVSAVTSVAVVTASFVGTVACLKTFRLERCFWIYILAFLSFFWVSINPVDAHNIQRYLHLESLDFFLIRQITDALQWTAVVMLLSAGIYLLGFRHAAGYATLIKIPLTIFFMCVFLHEFFPIFALYMAGNIFGILGLHM